MVAQSRIHQRWRMGKERASSFLAALKLSASSMPVLHSCALIQAKASTVGLPLPQNPEISDARGVRCEDVTT